MPATVMTMTAIVGVSGRVNVSVTVVRLPVDVAAVISGIVTPIIRGIVSAVICGIINTVVAIPVSA